LTNGLQINIDWAMPRSAGRAFAPKEVLFSPTAACNLACSHCSVIREKTKLPAAAAIRFLESCKKAGIERVGFTGGEPFLYPAFLFAVTASAVENGFLFDRITTNGVWFKDPRHLRTTLEKLRDRGYDGSFGVSVDAFHGNDPARVALFLKTATEIWNRPDVSRIVAVRGAQDRRTAALLARLAAVLNAKIVKRGGRRFIKNDSLIILISTVDLVPIGRAENLIEPWGRKWFKEDYCRGPGHVFYVLPDGSVKPCCGYATDADRLTIGNIHRDSAADLIRNAARNKFVAAVFERGLSRVRRDLAASGIVFPGKTHLPCFFCHYLLTEIPQRALNRCLGDKPPSVHGRPERDEGLPLRRRSSRSPDFRTPRFQRPSKPTRSQKLIKDE